MKYDDAHVASDARTQRADPDAPAAVDGSGWAEEALRALSRKGYRSASARRLVIDLLDGEGVCLDAQAVFDRLRDQGRRVGLATVYRTLDLLAELGYAQRVDLGAGAATCYEPVLPGRSHHHFVCTRCGRVESFDSRAVEDALAEVERRAGYLVAAREIVLRGSCRDCLAPNEATNAVR